jgi:hypothetical protein
MLVASSGTLRVDADVAERGVSYHCPGCHSPVMLRRGAVKVAHFAHKSLSNCGYASGETTVHMTAKLAFLRAFRGRGLRTEVEFLVPTLLGDRRADVMVWSPSGRQVAIEVQHSAISLEDLHRRSESYASSGIAVVWIPIIDTKILNNARTTEDGDLLIRRYAAPHWQRWINGINFGRMWVMTSDLRLWDAKLKPHIVKFPGGREKIVSKWKDLHLVGPVDLADVKLTVKRRPAAEIGPHQYPAGPLAQIVAQAPSL